MTFLFTDIEGSTRLWESQQAAMQVALPRHDALVRQCVVAHGGHVFKTGGDAFCAAFHTAPDALAAALEAQRALHAERWPEAAKIRVRMALHSGAVEFATATTSGRRSIAWPGCSLPATAGRHCCRNRRTTCAAITCRRWPPPRHWASMASRISHAGRRYFSSAIPIWP